MPEKAASRSPLTSKNERLRVRYDLHTKICTQIKENKEMDSEPVMVDGIIKYELTTRSYGK